MVAKFPPFYKKIFHLAHSQRNVVDSRQLKKKYEKNSLSLLFQSRLVPLTPPPSLDITAYTLYLYINALIYKRTCIRKCIYVYFYT